MDCGPLDEPRLAFAELLTAPVCGEGEEGLTSDRRPFAAGGAEGAVGAEGAGDVMMGLC